MNASTTLSSFRLVAGAALLSLSTLVAAQTAAAPTVPAADCTSPGEYPVNVKPGMNTIDAFQKKVEAYGKCMKDYVAVQRTKAEESIALAKAHQDAANDVVGKYNDYITSINEQAKKANK